MTTELSSAKYLPAELQEGYVAQESDIQATVLGHAIADPSQSFRPARKTPTGFVTFIACFLTLAGVLGVIGGAFGAIGQTVVANIDTAQISNSMSSKGQEAVVYRRAIETLKKFSLVVYLHNGICVLVGLGFIASCFLLMKRHPDASSFAATACMAAIFYNCLTVVVTWVTMPSFEGMSGIPDGAATMALAIAVGFSAFIALMKIGFYGFLIAYLSKPSIKAIYEPNVPEASVA